MSWWRPWSVPTLYVHGQATAKPSAAPAPPSSNAYGCPPEPWWLPAALPGTVSCPHTKRAEKTVGDQHRGLVDRLAQGPVLCAEGYLFELERRGYLQAGAYVPEVVLERPELVAQLHREFVHAGSDVVEAFTYYAHREKLRLIGAEDLLEPLNRQALAIAGEVARETGTLLAGDVCNTNVYFDDEASRRTVRAMFDEQVAW